MIRRAAIGKGCAPAGASADQHQSFGGYMLAVALGAALSRAGFTADAQPGDPSRCVAPATSSTRSPPSQFAR